MTTDELKRIVWNMAHYKLDNNRILFNFNALKIEGHLRNGTLTEQQVTEAKAWFTLQKERFLAERRLREVNKKVH